MEIKKVFVIVGKDVTKEMVIKDIREEGYPYGFTFSTDTQDVKYIEDSQEVWIFGNVEKNKLYDYALTWGKDIWRMG